MDGLELTAWQRRRLEAQLKHAETARLFRRTQAVLDAHRGRSVAEISQSLGVTRQSVYNWIDAYRQSGDPRSLAEGEHCGRPPFWDEESETVLRCLLEHRPEECGYYAVNWTAALLQQQIACNTGKPFSPKTIRKQLRRLGFVWKRGRYELLPDPELEKKTTHLPPNPRFAAPHGVAGRG